MNKVKLRRLIEAAKDKKPVEVQKIVSALLAEKIKDLIAEEKKKITIKP